MMRTLDFKWRIFLFFGSAITFLGCESNSFGQQNKVCFKDQCVQVEVVQKGEERTRGLQFRESLGKEAGMLFVFPQSQVYSFWMKDTWIPLDIIWLDYSKKIVYIEKNVSPCQSDPCPSYTPSSEALYVLEVNAHHSDELGVQIGDFAEFFIKD